MSSSSYAARRAIAGAALTCIAALVTACGSAAPGGPAGPGGTAAATPAASTATGTDTFIADSQDINGTPWHRPACHSGCGLSGDATSVLYNMSWAAWTAKKAVGTGIENVESCVPNCATGGQYRVPVTVTFSRAVRDCPGRSLTRWFWSQASFSYPHGLPKALQGANSPQNPWRFTAVIAEAKQSCS